MPEDPKKPEDKPQEKPESPPKPPEGRIFTEGKKPSNTKTITED